MSHLTNILGKVHDRRIRAGYRESGPPRERMPPDYFEYWIQYPTIALITLLSAIGAALAFIVLLIWSLVVANRVPMPAATPKVVPAQSALRAPMQHH